MSNTSTEKMVSQEQKLTHKDLMKVFWRSFAIECSFNYERMQGLGIAYSLTPIIKKLYKTKESLSAVIKRHIEFFNTTPQVSTLVLGIVAAMEEQKAAGKDVDENAIRSVKSGLMGPLAGIGDSFFWGTFRVIAAGVGASMMVKGNPMGILLFVLLYNIPHVLIRYYLLFAGYDMGVKVLVSARDSGILDKVSEAASIVGLMVVGCMTASYVSFSIPFEFTIAENAMSIQSIFDQIMPGILPLGLTLFVFYLLSKKNVNPTVILLCIVVFGVVGKLIGLL